MTAVSLAVTGAPAPASVQSRRSSDAGFALYVAGEDRALLAELAQALVSLVGERAPGAVTHWAFARGAVRSPTSAAERAQAAWRATTADRVVVDLSAHEVTAGGAPVPMTHQEFALLEYLLRSPHRAVTRQELLSTVWCTRASRSAATRTIDVHVRRLREKLGGCLQIVTIRGVGYRCDPSPAIVLVGSGDAG